METIQSQINRAQIRIELLQDDLEEEFDLLYELQEKEKLHEV